MLENVLFVLALSGSVLYLFTRLFEMFANRVNAKQRALEADLKKEAKVGPKVAPTLDQPSTNDHLKTMIDLVASQSEEIAKLNRVIVQTNERLVELEAAKQRAPRKTTPKAPAAGLGSFPPGQDPYGHEALPPVTGGFEPVH